MNLRRGFQPSATLFDYPRKLSERAELNRQMGEGDFWNDQKAAQVVINELKLVRSQIEPLEQCIADFEDAKVGYELSKESGDKELLKEADAALFRLQQRMGVVETQSLLGRKHDHRACFVDITAGAGGTEAEDWAGMLERMYL